MLIDQCRKDDPGKPADDSCQDHKPADDQCRDLFHCPNLQKMYQHRNKEYHSHHKQHCCDKGEELQRLVILEHFHNSLQDLKSICISIQLGLTSLRPVTIFNDYILNLHVLIDGVDRHLCLDLKIPGKYRECFYKAVTHGTVTCHDILDVAFEKTVNGTSYDAVSKVVERSLVLCKICRRKAVTNYHVCAFLQNLAAHFSCKLCRISIVAIYHKITLRINIPKHTADHVSFSLLILITDNCPFFSGDLVCSICRVIIIYVDHSFRKCFFHIADNLCYRLAFVVARN